MPDQQKTDHDRIVEIHSILCGNGNKGLCRQFEEHKQKDETFRKDYYSFKRWVITIAAFAIGSGIISGVSVAKLLGG